MPTVQTIIDAAFRKNAINLPSDAQRDNGLRLLNDMLDSWAIEGIVIPYTTTESFTLVAGTGTYTIGSGGAFNTARPIKIIDAYIRDSGSVDYPVNVHMNLWEYNAINDKNTSIRPSSLYYDTQYPLGIIYFDSLPSDAETFYLVSDKSLTAFSAVTDEITNLPGFYNEALIFNLAVRISTEEDTKILDYVAAIAVNSKTTLENLNAKDKLTKSSDIDSMLLYRSS